MFSLTSRRTLSPGRSGDAIFGASALGATLLVLATLVGVGIVLAFGAAPALHHFGLHFFWSSAWNPATDNYGALVAVYGTIVTSLIAMAIGVPLSFGIALFLTELCPAWARRPLSTAIELLAAIPSIIYGIWGLFVFAPFMQQVIQPALINSLGNIPGVGILFSGAPYGIGLLTAGIILGMMILPFITAITVDVFNSTPATLRESVYALGATTWEVVWRVVLPYGRAGVIGGVMLGLGRALGETMAVTFVIGNAHRITGSLIAPGTTIASALASEFTEAVGQLYSSSLIALGLILFGITFIVLAAARFLLLRANRRAEGTSR